MCVYLNLRNRANKFACIKYVLTHITNYQHVSIAFFDQQDRIARVLRIKQFAIIMKMITAKEIETYWQIIICDKTYFIRVNLLVLLRKIKY